MNLSIKRTLVALLISSVLAGGAVLPLMSQFPSTVYAASSGELGSQIRWTLSASGTLTLTGTGAIPEDEYVVYELTDAWERPEMREKVKKIVIGEGITDIGDQFCANFTETTEVVLPSTLTAIDQWAFSGMTSLQKINIPDSITSIGEEAFRGCESLETIVIPASVTEIGKAAFLSCSSLADVRLPEGLTALPTQCFYNCTALSEIDLPESLQTLGLTVIRN